MYNSKLINIVLLAVSIGLFMFALSELKAAGDIVIKAHTDNHEVINTLLNLRK